ncbi:unnamed protein product [Rangifer tarandus platyrhynchus]|uniref:Uncharacterized protein n=2 Tax=Rangifer tarandus platyrhynchus TaxID=3082113 RepID=A0AC59YMZ0_RANTA|nr:unnamed protein product [Rangifer tarandus platyrhynchus]
MPVFLTFTVQIVLKEKTHQMLLILHFFFILEAFYLSTLSHLLNRKFSLRISCIFFNVFIASLKPKYPILNTYTDTSVPAPFFQVNQGGTISEPLGRMGHLREESGPSVITLLCDHTPKTPSCGLRHPIALCTLDQGPGPECCRSTSGLQIDGRRVPSQLPGPGLVPVVSPRVRGSFSPWLPSFQIAISDWMPECHLLLITREGSLSHVQNLLFF